MKNTSLLRTLTDGGSAILIIYGTIYTSGLFYFQRLDILYQIPHNLTVIRPHENIVSEGIWPAVLTFCTITIFVVLVSMIDVLFPSIRKTVRKLFEWHFLMDELYKIMTVLTCIALSLTLAQKMASYTAHNFRPRVIVSCQIEGLEAHSYTQYSYLGETENHFILARPDSNHHVEMVNKSLVRSMTFNPADCTQD